MNTAILIKSKDERIDTILLCLFLASLLAMVWFPPYSIRLLPLAIVLPIMAFRLAQDLRNIASRDLQRQRFARETSMVLGITLGLAGVLAFVTYLCGTWQGTPYFVMLYKPVTETLFEKLPTVLFQQVLLQWFLVPILARCIPSTNRVAIVASVIFSLLHLPNPILMLLTLISSYFWVIAYQKFRRLLPLVASHFILAVLALGFCGEYIFHMRVGPDCFDLFPKKIEQLSQTGLEMPGCLMGRVHHVEEHGELAVIEGWVEDRNHNAPPEAFYIRLTDRFVEVPKVDYTPCPMEPREDFIEREIRQRYVFRAVVDKDSLPPEPQACLWAKNVNGWYCGIGDHFAITPSNANTVSTIAANSPENAVRQASATGGLDRVEFR